MRFVDLYPAKGFFSPGETISIVAEFKGEMPQTFDIHLSIVHLTQTIDVVTRNATLREDEQSIILEWHAPVSAPRGYGATAEFRDMSGSLIDRASTAFDVLPDWTAFPRYGFLTDFNPNRSDINATLDALVKFHINGLQFYDWQYRHDNLLPPESDYVDPLGRALSLNTVCEFVDAAHLRGMAVMAYMVVYAASVKFWEAHLEWALYNANKIAIKFEDFLGLMDPSPGSPWINHLLDECSNVIAKLHFDGLHVDQYGDPKLGFNASGDPIDIPSAFTTFIRTIKEIHPQIAVIFNAVGNWPIEALAVAPQDFIYIEIWPPDVHFRDLRRIVTNARVISNGKPVVIALYLPANHPENVCLADALILSLGGSRIELGEKANLLADPYFPKYQMISSSLNQTLRKYYDFVVRYGDLLGPTAKLLEECEVTTLPGVWTILRSCSGWIVLSLINFSGLVDPRWDDEQSEPIALSKVPVQITLTQTIRHIWWASPDLANMNLAPLPWAMVNNKITTTLPELDHWAIIAFELETEE